MPKSERAAQGTDDTYGRVAAARCPRSLPPPRPLVNKLAFITMRMHWRGSKQRVAALRLLCGPPYSERCRLPPRPVTAATALSFSSIISLYSSGSTCSTKRGTAPRVEAGRTAGTEDRGWSTCDRLFYPLTRYRWRLYRAATGNAGSQTRRPFLAGLQGCGAVHPKGCTHRAAPKGLHTQGCTHRVAVRKGCAHRATHKRLHPP